MAYRQSPLLPDNSYSRWVIVFGRLSGKHGVFVLVLLLVELEGLWTTWGDDDEEEEEEEEEDAEVEGEVEESRRPEDEEEHRGRSGADIVLAAVLHPVSTGGAHTWLAACE